ncbi:MAG: butyrate kinase [Lachnospiraceae bacterium]
MTYKIFTVNPGSTSTKIAMFEDEECTFSKNITHDAAILKTFAEIKDQLPYRRDMIQEALDSAGISLEGTAAFVGRGGGLMPLSGGTYTVNEALLHHARLALPGPHPATLGSQIAFEFASRYGGSCYVVNPPDVDEFSDMARMTGLKGIYRESRIHALNQKEIGIRYAESIDRNYDDLNLIICHIGGGISITAHQQGKMVDSNDILNGDGPMAPTRCGSISVKSMIKLCLSGTFTERELKDKVTKNGGWTDHLGTSDGLEICAMIENGNEYAKLVWDSTIYQINKEIGAMAAVLRGTIDAIVLTGGIAQNKGLTKDISDAIGFLAPIVIMAGEFEMEALAAGAIRVLDGTETAKEYTGVPVWNGFSYMKGYETDKQS